MCEQEQVIVQAMFDKCRIGKNIYVYGAGTNCCEYMQDFILKYGVKAVFDSDKNKIGNRIHNVMVMEIDQIKYLDMDKSVFIISPFGRFKEIVQTISSYGVKYIFSIYILDQMIGENLYKKYDLDKLSYIRKNALNFLIYPPGEIIELHNELEDSPEKCILYQFITDFLCIPNVNAINNKLQNNLKLLKFYPYIWGLELLEKLTENTFHLYPVDENEMYIYDFQTERFQIYDVHSDKQMKYFFSNLNDPIFVTNEDNSYNLKFLFDNVRSSEDVGTDNHIYLYYSDEYKLLKLLLKWNLREILEGQKFVFLIGQENKSLYPIDFGTIFGIDYETKSPKLFQGGTLKRTCFEISNMEKMNERLKSNLKLLKEYPYIWGLEKIEKMQQNVLQLCPINENEMHVFNRETGKYEGIYDVHSDKQMKYFFSNLDDPILVTNEDNSYNLKFLFDNVRSSEDVGTDNHIYLYYSDEYKLLRLLLSWDLEEILTEQKFVFLIGRENKELYPIDFRNKFGIDYEKMVPKPLQIKDLKRICYWYARAYSGTAFGIDVLNQNPYIWGDWKFHNDITVCGVHLRTSTQLKILLQDKLSNMETLYSLEQLEQIFKKSKIVVPFYDVFKEWMQKEYSEHEFFSLPELFRAWFLFRFRDLPEKQMPYYRVTPVILWEPHLSNRNCYTTIVKTFPYKFLLNSVRDPVAAYASANRRAPEEALTWFVTDYTLTDDQFEFGDQYYTYRFEDLKLNPEPTCRALCKLFQVPYTIEMLHSQIQAREVRGFDTTPVFRDLSPILSEFDQLRFRIMYELSCRYYKYPIFDSDEYHLTEEEVISMFSYPLRCEKKYCESQKGEVDSAEIRDRVFNIMINLYRKGKSGNVLFPKVIWPEKTEDKKNLD